MTLRIVSRAIIFDKGEILLVKNKGQSFWYPPGGEWKHEKENIKEAASREAREEVGVKVEIKKLLYLQEFHPKKGITFLEAFWLAELSPDQERTLPHNHIDSEGQVEKAKWHSKEAIKDITVFPKVLRDSFWEMHWKDREDLFVLQL